MAKPLSAAEKRKRESEKKKNALKKINDAIKKTKASAKSICDKAKARASAKIDDLMDAKMQLRGKWIPPFKHAQMMQF